MTHLPTPERLLHEAARALARKYRATPEEIARHILDAARVRVPVTAFGDALAPYETIVAYLRDVRGVSLADIARLTGRDPRAVGVTYRRAKKALGTHMVETATTHYSIPADILRDPRLSVLEHVVTHLHSTYRLPLAEIARMLHRDPRTIGTVARRARGRR